MKYYQLISNHKAPCPPSWEWVQANIGKIFCPECKNVLRKSIHEPINAVLGYNPPPGFRIEGLLTWVGLHIFHIKFIEQIRSYVDEYGFLVGKCFDNEKGLVPEYVTCYSPYYVIQRGNKDTGYRICETCGLIIQKQWWHGRQYLLKNTLEDQKIVQGERGSLYLDRDLRLSLDFDLWDDWDFEEVEILDEPEDGQNFEGYMDRLK